MEKLEFTLEVMNGSTVILGLFLMMWLFFHLYDMVYVRQEAGWSSVFFGIAGGISLASYILFEQIGETLTRFLIWLWRVHGAKLPFNQVEDIAFSFGGFFVAVGVLLMIRLLSRPRFGEGPWLAAGISTIAYVVIRTITHYCY